MVARKGETQLDVSKVYFQSIVTEVIQHVTSWVEVEKNDRSTCLVEGWITTEEGVEETQSVRYYKMAKANILRLATLFVFDTTTFPLNRNATLASNQPS